MIQEDLESHRQVAKSWNNLNTCFIENKLAKDFRYESQWVLMPIKGRKEFLRYLKSKFRAIRSAMLREQICVTAELAYHPGLHYKPIIVLKQITSTEVRQVSILIETKKSRIQRIDLCFNPDPNEALLSGECPK